MDLRDITAVGGAIFVVLIIALVVKPVSYDGDISQYVPENTSQHENSMSTMISPRSFPTITEDIPITPIPTPRIFMGTTTVERIEGIFSDYNPKIPGDVVTITPQNRSQNTIPSLIFEETYILRYSSVGLLVDVVKPPLILRLSTKPTTNNPMYKDNPYYCFLMVTVRDSITKEIVAENGYGRIYGTDHEKSITIYRSGKYNITLYGNLVQLKFSVLAEA